MEESTLITKQHLLVIARHDIPSSERQQLINQLNQQYGTSFNLELFGNTLYIDNINLIEWDVSCFWQKDVTDRFTDDVVGYINSQLDHDKYGLYATDTPVELLNNMNLTPKITI